MTSPSDLPDRLDRDRCLLVVVDLQERFRDLIHGMDGVLEQTGRLIRFCRELEIPIIVTEHYPRGLGHTIDSVKELCEPWQPIEKINFSCCGCPEFNTTLAGSGRDQIILCGIETHVCIYQTACDLLRQGKQVALATDASSSCSKANRKLGGKHLARLGVQNLGAQMIMFEILEKAGTPEFKAVADLLRD